MITIQVKKLHGDIDPTDGYILYVYHEDTKIAAEIVNEWEDVRPMVNKLKEEYKPEEIIFFDFNFDDV